MATHFHPEFDPELDAGAIAPCGVLFPEIAPRASDNWEFVTCKKCLKMKAKLKTIFKESNK